MIFKTPFILSEFNPFTTLDLKPEIQFVRAVNANGKDPEKPLTRGCVYAVRDVAQADLNGSQKFLYKLGGFAKGLTTEKLFRAENFFRWKPGRGDMVYVNGGDLPEMISRVAQDGAAYIWHTCFFQNGKWTYFSKYESPDFVPVTDFEGSKVFMTKEAFRDPSMIAIDDPGFVMPIRRPLASSVTMSDARMERDIANSLREYGESLGKALAAAERYNSLTGRGVSCEHEVRTAYGAHLRAINAPAEPTPVAAPVEPADLPAPVTPPSVVMPA